MQDIVDALFAIIESIGPEDDALIPLVKQKFDKLCEIVNTINSIGATEQEKAIESFKEIVGEIDTLLKSEQVEIKVYESWTTKFLDKFGVKPMDICTIVVLAVVAFKMYF